MTINPYKPFTNFVLRAPLFSISIYKELTSGRLITDKTFKTLFGNALIKEAVFLASPNLYSELEKWFKDEIDDKKKAEKLKHSFLKYISRMSSRCTPFGLFAGCAIGELGDDSKIRLEVAKRYERHTRLDMNYLVALAQDLSNEKGIKEQLLFYPNTSIYKAGDRIRYIEYCYIKGKRHHDIVAVDNSTYLERVLKAAKEGALPKELADLLVDEEVSQEEALAFVEELISNQLLISELEPSVSGPEFFGQMKQTLSKLKRTEKLVHVMCEMDGELAKIDSIMGNSTERYIKISNKLKDLGTEFELKFLFQTDMVLKPSVNLLNKSIISSIEKGISLFNKITLPPKETFLKQFQEAFYERFGEREVALSLALDVEMGIGYKQNENSLETNPLIDDIVLPTKNNVGDIAEIPWSPIDSILQKKLIQAFINKDYRLTLTDDDFKDFEENWEDWPYTFSTMVEMVKINGKSKIKLNNVGGSSAANLIGRFCHGDKSLKKHAQKIVDEEAEMNRDKILAEIVHLPESRIGNILMRPAFRKYEIPYLAKSVLELENQLPLDDLFISFSNDNKIALKSKKHNKEVVPHLTNSHNFSANALPIYHFLCDLQTQGKRKGFGLNLGPFAHEYEFIPRIEYKDLIFSEAVWNLKKSDLEPLQKVIHDDDKLFLELELFRKTKKIPKYVMLKDGDNELLINFDNLTSTRMLLQTVMNRENFKLSEFLFADDGIVKSNDGKEYYSHQIVLSFYNGEKLKNGHGG